MTSHALGPPPPSQTVTPSRTPFPLKRDVLYGRPLISLPNDQFTSDSSAIHATLTLNCHSNKHISSSSPKDYINIMFIGQRIITGSCEITIKVFSSGTKL